MSLNPATVSLVVMAVFLAVVFLIVISLTRRRGHGLNRDKYRSEWMKLENSLNKNNMMTYQMAVVTADKLLDQAMKDVGLSGETMADRLKVAKSKLMNVDKVWKAHKLRNRIVHETDVKISVITGKKVLYIYKNALKDLGAI